VQEPLADGGVVAVADRAHHVPAVVAEVLRGLLAHDVPLVRHERDKGDEGAANDRPQRPAGELLPKDLRSARPGNAHGATISTSVFERVPKIIGGGEDAGAVRPEEPRRRLQDLGVRASKGLGQHFLLDERIADRHVELGRIRAADTVLEIGPGLGILTERLLGKAAKVLAVEKDRRLARALRDLDGNLEVIEGDAVRVPLPAFDKVVSNLPYQISSPITFRLLDLSFDRAALMYQREFAERLVAKRGTEDYSRLAVKAYVRCRAEIVQRVPRAAFWPQPKVDSAIVVLEPRPFPFPVTDEGLFDAVVDATFEHRRKTIENGLRLSWRRFAGSEAAFARMLDAAPYRRNRPEELAPEQFGELVDALAHGKG